MAAKPARTGVRSIYTVGNHELNFERRLATQVPMYEGLPGLRLADHLKAVAGGHLNAPDRIAIHGRGGKGRLGKPGCD